MSDDEARGDDVYQPGHSDVDNRPTDDLDLENAVGERDLDETLDEGYSPPERALGVTKYGTTGEEQREGEALDQRLAQETPDVRPPEGDDVGDLPGGEGEPLDESAADTRAGRIAPVAEEAPRRNIGVLGRDVGIDGGAASAEEAAMHVEPADGEEAGGAR
ncbi:DUF5709 domain-containing protein [Streptomyces agglomeratus]|uniref:DUF5709 domain-containing protein n=1 Tax=Streptomyces agglomeratus TaxID=285458 RepID=UPI00085468FE|nr:DUF5709 domain-containing protein [Streptomyces agglomeratus]OEJ50063.1 hypothetical protein BGK72_04115 [Streptomyces agglomeratus]